MSGPYEQLKERGVPMVEIVDKQQPRFVCYVAKLEDGVRIGVRGLSNEISMVLHTDAKAFAFISDVQRMLDDAAKKKENKT